LGRCPNSQAGIREDLSQRFERIDHDLDIGL
jgi:hypothetical protein